MFIFSIFFTSFFTFSKFLGDKGYCLVKIGVSLFSCIFAGRIVHSPISVSSLLNTTSYAFESCISFSFCAVSIFPSVTCWYHSSILMASESSFVTMLHLFVLVFTFVGGGPVATKHSSTVASSVFIGSVHSSSDKLMNLMGITLSAITFTLLAITMPLFMVLFSGLNITVFPLNFFSISAGTGITWVLSHLAGMVISIGLYNSSFGMLFSGNVFIEHSGGGVGALSDTGVSGLDEVVTS